MNDATLSRTLDEEIARRVSFLTGYQNAAYANRYKTLVDKVRATEQQKSPGFTSLAEAVARYAFKLMAYKDEYEVARLYTSGAFEKEIRETFDGDYKIHFNLAPPLFARKDPATGLPRKMKFGGWMWNAFALLAKFKFLRGTPFDLFGYTHERKTERKLVKDYEAWLQEMCGSLNGENHALAIAISSIPEKIRGYGHIKEGNVAAARKRHLLDGADPTAAATMAAALKAAGLV